VTWNVPLGRIPVLVRAGSVIPTLPLGARATTAPAAKLVLTAYPGSAGTGELYDDAGAGFGYRRGELSRTTLTQTRRDGVTTVRIGRARGSFPGKPSVRTWDLRIEAVGRPATVTLNGVVLPRATTAGGRGWSYDPATRSLRVVVTGVPTGTDAVVRVQ
jgi:hypothetical protein